MIIATFILLIFTFIWMFPVYKNQGMEDKLPKKYYVIAFILGILAMPVSVLISSPIMLPLNQLHLEGYAKDLQNSIVLAGFAEELGKFLMAWLLVRKIRPVRKIDAILMFGMVGTGFQVVESIFYISSIIDGIIRGVFADHMLWLFWQGAFYWEAEKCKSLGDKKGKRRNMCIALLVPMVIHALYDSLVFTFSAYEQFPAEYRDIIVLISAAVLLIMSITYAFFTERMAIRVSKASRNGAEKI